MDKLEDLILAHPALFRGAPPVVMSHLPAGWYGLLDRLCSDIERLLDRETERFRVEQIKEKFGTLRFYWSLDDAGDAVADFIDGSGAHVGKFVLEAQGDRLRGEIRALVLEAEGRSATACQDCGAAGTLETRRGWASTLCDAHAASRGR